MSLLATRQDFEPANPTEGATALYYAPNAVPTGYQQYPWFQARIDGLKGRFAPNNQKLAIWGCGFGYLVSLAVTAGYDAYGFDASSYAIGRGKTLLPAIAARLFVRDALVAADVTASAGDAGIHGGNPRFTLLLTEDLFTCMSDAEIQTALPLLRARSAANLGHMLWVQERSGLNPDARINWKTAAAWKAILAPPDLVLGVDGEAL